MYKVYPVWGVRHSVPGVPDFKCYKKLKLNEPFSCSERIKKSGFIIRNTVSKLRDWKNEPKPTAVYDNQTKS